ncbi:alpha/beta hydrolase [Bradyrhizobium prioriisuperbiae]|uniref:alpha/beta fold hydrolase n=1 Tax=Bradyrhizobium prioriisuperbiae TaxID=2854389 RepID=UPI0028EC7B57|nr:alpha/beta hydrolase [Bradyrhizobium prioritasuperba]
MEQIRANGISVAFQRRGNGPPLVLMHGNEADHAMFDALVECLIGDFTVYAYDQRDCGQTENPALPYTLADLGDDAAAFITALGLPRAHVYGSSLGGLVAQSLAARHPDSVDRLVLGNTWRAGISPVEFNPEGIKQMAAYRADLAAYAPKLAELFFPPAFIRQRPSIVEMFRAGGRSEDKRTRRGAVISQTAPAELSRFPRPVLLLTGSEDRMIPPAATAALADTIPDARLVTLDGVGHVGVIQVPDLVARIVIDFLREAA